MLIDKPRCNFKNCKYCFDGNCISADKYENCQLTDLHSEIAKLTVDLDNAKSKVVRDILDDAIRAVYEKTDMKIYNTIDRKPLGDHVAYGKQMAMYEVITLLAELKKKYT